VARTISIWLVGGVLLTAVPAGCLDPGPPPRGRHLVGGRDQENLILAPGPVGAGRRILLSEIGRDGGLVSRRLSTVDDPGEGTLPRAPRLLLDNVGESWRQQERGVQPVCSPGGCPPPVDAAGRLYLQHVTVVPYDQSSGAVRERYELVRVDPRTGNQELFGEVRSFQMSPDRTRFAYLQEDGAGKIRWTVVAPDGSRAAFSDTGTVDFIGDDLFSVDEDAVLLRWPADATAPVPVASGVGFYQIYLTERGALLVLWPPISTDMGNDPDPPAAVSLFDPTSGIITVLPPATASADTIVVSPSGRYLATQKQLISMSPEGVSSSTRSTLFDRDAGLEMIMQSPANPDGPPFWRPRHDEAWFVLGGDLWRWPAGAAPTIVASVPLPLPGTPALYRQVSAQQVLSSFTPDGRFWVEVRPDPDLHQPVALRWADDFAQPAVPLNPAGTGVSGLWPLDDGRMLVEAWITENRRNDFHLVDPDAGTTRAMPGTGSVVATGRARFLALLNFVSVSSSGDLTLIDYASGEHTLIAENVHDFAVDASPDPQDALAPGTRLVYLVRNRIASPYDGCWAVELP